MTRSHTRTERQRRVHGACETPQLRTSYSVGFPYSFVTSFLSGEELIVYPLNLCLYGRASLVFSVPQTKTCTLFPSVSDLREIFANDKFDENLATFGSKK